MLRRWWRVKSLHYFNLFWGSTTILGSRLKVDEEHCVTWGAFAECPPTPKDGSHFLFGDFDLKEAVSAEFGGKLHTVLRLLCDNKKDFWKIELLRNSRIFVTVFLVVCISRCH